MGKKLTITPPIDILTDTSITRPDLLNWFTNAVFGGVDRDHQSSVHTGATIGATAPTAPKTGELWVDTSAGIVLRIWSGSAWQGATGFTQSATAPASPSNGDLWYDQTLDLLRVYETDGGLTGWHPADSAYQLVENDSLDFTGTLSKGALVGSDYSHTTQVRLVGASGTIGKEVVNALGFCMEDIADGATGVVATLAAPYIECLADSADTWGAIAIGDYVAYDGTLTVRKSGSTNGNHHPGQGTFGIARSTRDGTTNLVTVQSFGYFMGERREAQSVSELTLTADGTTKQVSVTSSNGQGPKTRWRVRFEFDVLSTSPVDATLTILQSDGSTTHDTYTFKAPNSAADEHVVFLEVDVPLETVSAGTQRWNYSITNTATFNKVTATPIEGWF